MKQKIIFIALAAIILVVGSAFAVEQQKNEGGNWLGRPLRDPELARVMSVIDRGWRTGLEAGLDRNRGQEARFEKELERFYGTSTPREVAAADARARGEAPAATTASNESIMAFDPLAPTRAIDENTSELAKQKSYIEAGRANERAQSFRVLDFGVDNMLVREHTITNDSARVVVDITYWSLYLFDDGTHQTTARPKGTETHTFELRRENDDWKIVSDTFHFAPGSEP
jgi:hypothetical protein